MLHFVLNALTLTNSFILATLYLFAHRLRKRPNTEYLNSLLSMRKNKLCKKRTLYFIYIAFPNNASTLCCTRYRYLFLLHVQMCTIIYYEYIISYIYIYSLISFIFLFSLSNGSYPQYTLFPAPPPEFLITTVVRRATRIIQNHCILVSIHLTNKVVVILETVYYYCIYEDLIKYHGKKESKGRQRHQRGYQRE
jgi:hypothetical protein